MRLKLNGIKLIIVSANWKIYKMNELKKILNKYNRNMKVLIDKWNAIDFHDMTPQELMLNPDVLESASRLNYER